MSLRTLALMAGCLLLVGCAHAGDRIDFHVDPGEHGSMRSVASLTLFVREGQEATIEVDAPEASWFIKYPIPMDYDNSGCTDGTCIQPIHYDTVELKALTGKRTVSVQDVPQLRGLGTHELIIKADGGAMALQVVVRRDDSYVGYLTELIGVPFVYGPRATDGGHQADLREGADCVALIIYGKRRQGRAVPYVAPPRLYDFATVIGDSDSLAETAIAPGDILHFGFQTAVVSRDNPPLGRLDDSDIIIQTYHTLAEEKPLGQLPYRAMHFDILRWQM